MSSAIAFALGLCTGVAASVGYLDRGSGFGDMDYDYFTFIWRGRRLELHVEKAGGSDG